MTKPGVVVVHLRQPIRSNPKEKRSDPFWEFGSFGITGCHSKNLMNPKKASDLNGVRLAFAQGGQLGVRLVYLSPPIKISSQRSPAEATWQPHEMPFKYSEAPVLIDRVGKTDFHDLKNFLKRTHRGGWPAKFSSRFRSRRRPLEEQIATQLVQEYEKKRARAHPSAISQCYLQALPYLPRNPDGDRESTYSDWQQKSHRRKVLPTCKPKRAVHC